MKPHLLLALALTSFSYGEGANPPVKNITVIQSITDGWEVTANGVIAIESPDGKRTNLSEPFKTKDTDWTPIKAIVCEWSPSGLVAVFAHHPRLTETYVFNTKTGQKLKQTFPQTKFPDWYDGVQTVVDEPSGKWVANQLDIGSTVLLKNKTTHPMKQILRVTGDTFTITPDLTGKKAPAGNPVEKGPKPLPKPEEKKPTGIEF